MRQPPSVETLGDFLWRAHYGAAQSEMIAYPCVGADRVGMEAVGVDASWVGYLQFCAQSGLGEADLSRIEVRGARLAEVAKKYQMHPSLEHELKWMGPMKEVAEKLG